MDKMASVTATPPSSGLGGGVLATVARVAVRAPFTQRAWAELAYCLLGFPLAVAGLVVIVALLGIGAGLTVTLVGAIPGLLVLVTTLPAGRGLGTVHRRLAGRLLGERVTAPPPFRPGRGLPGRLSARLRDGTGWRAVAYVLLKVPVSVLGCYAVAFWAGGLVNMTYPVWWGGFRNHPPGTHLDPVPVITPLPMGRFQVATFAGTFLALAVGAATLLLAPWVTRAVVAADRWLVRGLLGPGALAQRVRDLEQTRALAVDDSAVMLRRLERDLHDGAQIRLATLAMNLGMAKEKLGDDGDPLDVTRARELVDAAHRGAKDALVELRDLAKGIHPPVLDNGLADALATLAAGSAIPVELTTDIPERPTPAIETIAYFCAAELLANAAKHSYANKLQIQAAEREGALLLSVTDDGAGGADPARGSGLSGLAQRVSTVDGRLDIASPPGGPTRITVELPLRA
jgi:signal transduction histidine kinase